MQTSMPIKTQQGPPLQAVVRPELQSSFRFAVDGSSGSDAELRATMGVDEAARYVAGKHPEYDRLAHVSFDDPQLQGTTSVAQADLFRRARGGGFLGFSAAEGARYVDGLERIRTQPWNTLAPDERRSFTGANVTMLHELFHITRKPGTDISGWAIEEGLIELLARGKVRDWMKYEYEVDVSADDLRLPAAQDAYASYATRAGALVASAGFRDVLEGARQLVQDAPMEDAYDVLGAGMKQHLPEYAAIEAEVRATSGEDGGHHEATALSSRVIDSYLESGTVPGSPTLERVLRAAEQDVAPLLT
ncbi:MAG: hypothetical protein JWM90_2242 [Thermoleophilia bacterium]|nr:hypothetical protein [Thermoleophilia bacterium]